MMPSVRCTRWGPASSVESGAGDLGVFGQGVSTELPATGPDNRQILYSPKFSLSCVLVSPCPDASSRVTLALLANIRVQGQEPEDIAMVGFQDGSMLVVRGQAGYTRTLRILVPKPTLDAKLSVIAAAGEKAEEARTSVKKGKYEKQSVELKVFQDLLDKYVAEIDKILEDMKTMLGVQTFIDNRGTTNDSPAHSSLRYLQTPDYERSQPLRPIRWPISILSDMPLGNAPSFFDAVGCAGDSQVDFRTSAYLGGALAAYFGKWWGGESADLDDDEHLRKDA
ncbi:uncharacterized protein EV420DRAFT_1726595 [Desarmillaria tabescens]|uniref:Uncharacterized protein n=1 Tax=Armillaria tabescens TaxID=1929756 RepID=A0AA39JI97_ARMTA|nr:uncharacterized protein EV420DRAFT_1726595 [Desarmillaria tabescens]KAK0443138.1 hypothetical protein EV420DRAFT_1726595 [Desarmillaria tabescens]